MRHSPLTSRRAAVYQWFSQLLFQELSEAQLAALGSQESRVWIASLSAIPGLASDIKGFERSLTRVLQRAARAQELAADFASLFLLAPPVGVSPYAGHYPHTTPAQERRQMNALLVEQELAPRENEASDHIAIQLALMASCQQRDARGFYVLAVVMMVHFMREDAQYLQSLLMDDVDCRNH
ncbi:molecular chaperone TorD family protein [Salmonella enterica]|uniref:Molecular chaperone TorD n=1 Tax=Salmonella enterica subsp. diarizonae serovar 48:i:z TaxID=1192842 RepID=A0A7U5YHY9_SALDZ|nr:molecular chaperone TorD family protein [Salmonella enterica]EAA4451095.1 molecular chaperone TorD [Salmonella enterica subsp. diarizonae]EDW6116146.1 molecular chaperone TorD [Salmonella enterica subsp. salamae]AXC73264.1 molecular chaperone TorD [Salmonella enterica subsp. diarizonae serovar 48:i:z]EAM2670773.1 molecular chaperone TorD [Salmonella enterica]EAM6406828.1 molecular chaperone TorD [Salmonella enterica]